MSIQAIAWVLESSTTKGADRLVLLSLANHANDQGECYPSASTIAREANLNEVHVRRTLKALVDAGCIARTINAAPDERIRKDRRPNLYAILDGCAQKCPPWMERVTEPRADGWHNDAPTGGTSTRERVRAEVLPNRHIEPSVEPSLKPNRGDVEAIFDAWTSSTGKQRCTLDPKRRRLITTALASYPAGDLLDAVNGWKWSPYHCGQNDRGTVYNDIGLLLRDAKYIEQFRDWERGIGRPNGNGVRPAGRSGSSYDAIDRAAAMVENHLSTPTPKALNP